MNRAPAQIYNCPAPEESRTVARPPISAIESGLARKAPACGNGKAANFDRLLRPRNLTATRVCSSLENKIDFGAERFGRFSVFQMRNSPPSTKSKPPLTTQPVWQKRRMAQFGREPWAARCCIAKTI